MSLFIFSIARSLPPNQTISLQDIKTTITSRMKIYPPADIFPGRRRKVCFKYSSLPQSLEQSPSVRTSFLVSVVYSARRPNRGVRDRDVLIVLDAKEMGFFDRHENLMGDDGGVSV